MSRRYVVAGGLGVLGRAVAAYLAETGHKVATIDLAPAPADADGIVFGGVNLGDEKAVRTAYAQASGALGGLDGVVNVAGGFLWETVADGSIDSWDRMFAMNVRTTVISSKAALEHLGRGGAIVNVGAAAAASVATGMAPYAASKMGVAALTEGLAEEMRPRGIRVNAVVPTVIDTPANRKDMPDADTSSWISPVAVAKVITFLLSPDSDAVTGVGIKLSVGG